MPRFKIRSGCSFRVDADMVKNGGDMIELDEDIAQLHSDKIEALDDPTTVLQSEIAEDNPEHL
jgi:hypothetical protein